MKLSAKAFSIGFIMASPYHPQTNDKIGRYHRSIKGELHLVPYELSSELREAIKAFVDHCPYRPCHDKKTIGECQFPIAEPYHGDLWQDTWRGGHAQPE